LEPPANSEQFNNVKFTHAVASLTKDVAALLI